MIQLVHNTGGFNWYADKNLSVKGYLFNEQGEFFEKADLLSYFKGISGFTEFEERISAANGCFSVILSIGNDIFAGCDPIRAFPVFYSQIENSWHISDDPYLLLKAVSGSINDSAYREFLATGYVTGRETLIKEISEIQAAEIVSFSGSEIKQKFYSSYLTAETSKEEYEDIRQSGINCFNDTFLRIINSLKGRTVVLPLSGGFDSRLIAVMLKKYGYEKVICITYGRHENPDIRVSEKVAKKLGFKWICVDYTDELIKGYISDPYFSRYYKFASGLVSMFFLQEYFAVRYLKENRLIPDDSIFIPGHSGDFLGGSQLYKHENIYEEENLNEIAGRLYYVKYCYKRPAGKQKELMLERIENSLREKLIIENPLAYSIHEDWDYKEKLAKFNANSVSTYTFFGYGFRLPYWDKQLVEFFRQLPLHMKLNKFLYDDILTNKFFETEGVDFEEELQPSPKILKQQKIKNRVKYFLPNPIKRLFLKRKDNLYYNEITRELIDEIAKSGKKLRVYNNSYNSIIIQWYLEKLKKEIG